MTSKTSAALPPSLVSRSDATRLLREIKDYDELATQRSLAKGTKRRSTPTRHSEQLIELAEAQSLSLASAADRDEIINQLASLLETAPAVHIDFATEPSARALHRIVQWFREEIHPQALVEVGLQPSLVAGCVVRTTNRYFDYSVRSQLDETHESLQKKIGALAGQA